ncbi:hypothetical protein AB0F72_08660 [Actinoplanes sp. NPDC023936]|uniref:hypothetical protein n=1 Tax=Actinoplanes sp. NPDC023936 TaxID=3154910 RepID=UPI0033D13F77
MPSHPESVTAVLTASEPPNGTVLVVQYDQDGSMPPYKVIWRDDDAQTEAYGPADKFKQRWLEDPDDEPMALHEYLKYATAVYALGEKLVEFP